MDIPEDPILAQVSLPMSIVYPLYTSQVYNSLMPRNASHNTATAVPLQSPNSSLRRISSIYNSIRPALPMPLHVSLPHPSVQDQFLLPSDGMYSLHHRQRRLVIFSPAIRKQQGKALAVYV